MSPDDVPSEAPWENAVDLTKLGDKWKEALKDRQIELGIAEVLQSYGDKKNETLKKCADTFAALTPANQAALFKVFERGHKIVARGAVLCLIQFPPHRLNQLLGMHDQKVLARAVAAAGGKARDATVSGHNHIAMFFTCVAILNDANAQKTYENNEDVMEKVAKVIQKINQERRSRQLPPLDLRPTKEGDVPEEIKRLVMQWKPVDVHTFQRREDAFVPSLPVSIHAKDDSRMQLYYFQWLQKMFPALLIGGGLQAADVFRTPGAPPQSFRPLTPSEQQSLMIDGLTMQKMEDIRALFGTQWEKCDVVVWSAISSLLDDNFGGELHSGLEQIKVIVDTFYALSEEHQSKLLDVIIVGSHEAIQGAVIFLRYFDHGSLSEIMRMETDTIRRLFVVVALACKHNVRDPINFKAKRKLSHEMQMIISVLEEGLQDGMRSEQIADLMRKNAQKMVDQPPRFSGVTAERLEGLRTGILQKK